MNIIVVGGAGYIGSHVVKEILENTDYNVSIIDNLSTGSILAIKTLENMHKSLNKKTSFEFIKADLKDVDAISDILKTKNFDAVLHFAASIIVPESVKDPLKYYTNNTINTINLVKLCVDNKINKFIFSSTAAVYGNPQNSYTIKEDTPTNPINPYGKSKLISEMVLEDTSKAYKDFKYISLRYFNVAGADVKLRIGQMTPNSTLLIKVAAEVALGKRDKLFVFGTDYPTKDGTGIRDYIHVDDLADAHLKALDFLIKNNVSDIFNCGYGHGYSVLDVINTMKEVSGVDFKVEFTKRRHGDPAVLVADNTKIIQNTNWRPQYDDLKLICKTALEWEKKLSDFNMKPS